MYFLYYTGFGIFPAFRQHLLQPYRVERAGDRPDQRLSPGGHVERPILGILGDHRYGKTRVLLAIAVIGSVLAGWGIAAAGTFMVIVPIATLFSLFYSTIEP